jgi:molybdopterin-containing oxidoreductase family iron-sulfur binding subunit
MKKEKRYWKGVEELSNDPEFVKHADREFPTPPKKGDTRRDFLKAMGFTISAATLAACEAPIRKAIPYVVKPVDVDPSIPNYYASTFIDGGDYCSVVVKTREGRPIKIKGNNLSPITQGRVNAQVEASVLSLYDSQRIQGPVINREPATWSDLDEAVTSQLRDASSVALVSYTILSPSTQATIDRLLAAYPNMRHVVYDPISSEGILEANRQSFGQAVIPAYDFSKADTIVSFGADFLGTWIAPIVYARQYGDTRKLGSDKKKMSRHYQFESNLSLTGANADYRAQIRASQEGLLVGHLYNLLAARAGSPTAKINKTAEVPLLAKAANDLWASRGKSLVVSGSNDPAVQSMVNAINGLLRNYGTTIDLQNPAYYRQGSIRAMDQLAQQAGQGSLDGVIFYNCNPVYDYYNGAALAEGLNKVKLKISTSDRLDETTVLADYIAPDNHYLESWNDAQPQGGHLSLAQPTITPIFDTRQAQSTFLTWSGSRQTDYYQFLRDRWRSTAFAAQDAEGSFENFWNTALYKGVIETSSPTTGEADGTAVPADLGRLANAINSTYPAQREGIELVLYQKVGIGNGRQANNPWLQEMPDPISKACWDNYLTMSLKMANELGVEMEEMKTRMARVTANGTSVVVPVLVQPGQAEGTVGLALGYGRTKAGKVADGVGANAYPMVGMTNGFVSYFNPDVQIEILEDKYRIAQTQTHETYMGRETVIQDALLSEYLDNPAAGRYKVEIETYDGPKEPNSISLWKGHVYPNHHWMMAIDMNSCIGCGACTVACQVENNVPVVGRQEVINRREMHWIRIDRYYSSDAVEGYKDMEVASANPLVTFQPMLCQQCNNAPCETVCPVLATTHSTEGLNQMTYNRCIGTRYCANNCPYKVRRFNWFKYHDNEQFAGVNIAMNDDLAKMVLNPDVTVRARGVMEKCTFCVQRIQLGKLEAKKQKRRPLDGEIVSACAEACPTRAITFGDANDPNSAITRIVSREYEERAYRVLNEIGVSPNIWYLTKIRNKDEEEVTA